ncbi:MAG: hypothetical protein HYT87_03695 [Nitrospirae bacterium]|nr:hypothetical protein [Nitrospirota bacterium]
MNIGDIRVLTALALSWVVFSGFCWSVDKSAKRVEEAITKGEVAGATEALEEFREDCEESPVQFGMDEYHAKQHFQALHSNFRGRISSLEEQEVKQAMRVQVDRMTGDLGDSPLVCHWERWPQPKEGPCPNDDHKRNICADADRGIQRQSLVMYSFCGEKIKSVKDLVRLKNECKAGEIQLLSKEAGEIISKKWPGNYCFPFDGLAQLDLERQEMDREKQIKEFGTSLESLVGPLMQEGKPDAAYESLTSFLKANENLLDSREELPEAARKAIEPADALVKKVLEPIWTAKFKAVESQVAQMPLEGGDRNDNQCTMDDILCKMNDVDWEVEQESRRIYSSSDSNFYHSEKPIFPKTKAWLEAAAATTRERAEKVRTQRITKLLNPKIAKCASLTGKERALMKKLEKCKKHGCPPAELGTAINQLQDIDGQLSPIRNEFDEWVNGGDRRGGTVPELETLKRKAFSAGCLF